MNGSVAPGMPFAESSGAGTVHIETFATLDALPSDAEALFAANPGLFSSRAWWRNVLAYGMAEGAEACFALCRMGGVPAALFPLCRPGRRGVLTCLTTPYS